MEEVVSSHLRGGLRSQKLKQSSKRGRCTVLLQKNDLLLRNPFKGPLSIKPTESAMST